MAKKIGIVGAGVGGLSAAARLASRGHEVGVFERLSRSGGRNNLFEEKGFKFDMGPSFVLMPDFFEEIFTYCGQNLKDYLDLRILDPAYKIFFSDATSLTFWRDSERTKEELERLEKGSAKAFDGFIRETSRIYQLVRPLLYDCFTPKVLASPSYWSLALKIGALDSYWKLASRFFKSEKLRLAFTFEAMFMGVSPFNAPAFYSVISYADHVQKIYHPMGGMYQIPLALERLGKKFGARFYFNSEAGSIVKNDGQIGITVNGLERSFDKVIINADYAYARSELLKSKLPHYRYSCSVYLLYLGLKKKVSGLAHHNLFFAKDPNKNLREVFDSRVVSDDPSFYVHVPTVTDPSLAPKGKEVLYVLVPVPNLERGREDISLYDGKLRGIVFNRLKSQFGIDLEDLIEVERRFYPHDFIKRYNIRYGATFGLAHNLMQSAFFRPPNYSPDLPEVYFVGASTQPGGGLPVVIASSRIVADKIEREG